MNFIIQYRCDVEYCGRLGRCNCCSFNQWIRALEAKRVAVRNTVILLCTESSIRDILHSSFQVKFEEKHLEEGWEVERCKT